MDIISALTGNRSKASDEADERHPEPGVDSKVREQIIAEYLEQDSIEEFKRQRPELWLQVLRLGKVIELQEDLEEQRWPRGSCFIHAATPAVSSFCVEQVLEVDLDTCTACIRVYESDELEAGTIILPIETICWCGFPDHAVNVGFHFRGFTAGLIDRP